MGTNNHYEGNTYQNHGGSNSVTVEIRGLAELEQKLRNEMKNVAKKVLRKAGKRAAQIWKDAIEQTAPVGLTGYLESHIATGSETESGHEGSMTVKVGPGKGAFYGLFDEFGTSKQAAKPFMRPVFDAHQNDVLQVFVDELWNALQDLQET